MTSSVIGQLRAQLANWRQAPAWCVAFSGGLDSTVLLHALVAWAQQESLPALRAIHIHHGLQEAAESWPQHCQKICRQLKVPLQVLAVQVGTGASLEQAARQARYSAFAENLGSGEVLLLAQHQDDQVETLLFRLLRGAGVAGLQGMPVSRSLTQAHLVRPLLKLSRQQLEQYARQQQLYWIDDPSNATDSYDRNFLRQQIIPRLRERWPGLLPVMQRTAEHMREAQELLDALAQQDLQQATQRLNRLQWFDLPCLDLTVVRQLSLSRQKNLLRFWLTDKTQAVDTAHWSGWQDLCEAKADAQPLWQLAEGALLRSQSSLYWLPSGWQTPVPKVNLAVTEPGDYVLPNNGTLRLTGEWDGALEIRYRQGGEKLRLANRGQRDLKRLLQEQNIPAFLRNRLPLAFLHGRLVAVANCPALSHLQLNWHPPVF